MKKQLKETHYSIVKTVKDTPRPLAAAKMNPAIAKNITRWNEA